MICPLSQGGAIDPSVFVTGEGIPHILWKSDGERYNLPTVIYSQRLASDGLSVTGPAAPLIHATQAWEGGVVEAPSMVQAGSTYWVLYSANKWSTPDYAIGVARCLSISGPCTKPIDHPWLSGANTRSQDEGPGGQEFVTAGTLVWMVHHGYPSSSTASGGGQ